MENKMKCVKDNNTICLKDYALKLALNAKKDKDLS